MPTVSFVIPTYNRSAILIECLRVLEREQQSGTGPPFEVVIVDDGSTDATVDEVKELQHLLSTPIKLIQQENRGPAAARNLGVEAARGEVVIFLGDDIIVQPGYLAVIYGAYQAHAQETCGVLGHTRYDPCSIPTPFGRWLDREGGLQFAYGRAREDAPVGFDLFYTSNILVPRDALVKAGGFNEGFSHAAFEDTELGYRLMKLGLKLHYSPGARTLHIHPVSIESVAARMRVTAQAALELRSLNPELFTLLYPRAETRFAHPSRRHRIIRWIFTGPVLALLKLIDNKLHAPLPGGLYQRALYCVQTQAISRLWLK